MPLNLPITAPRSSNVGTLVAEDEISHRRPHVVWANHETLQTATPTRGTALIQHGLKEWLGADGGTRLGDMPSVAVGRQGAAQALARTLSQVLDACEDSNALPIVVCSEIELVAGWVSSRLEREHGLLMAVGSPYSGPAGASGRGDEPNGFPLRLQNSPAAAARIWLGAPGEPVALKVPVAGCLRVDARQTTVRQMPQHLAAAQTRVHEVAPATVACVLYLDDMDLHDNRHGGLPAGVFAATLRWLQSLVPWAVVFVVSHERVTASERGTVAQLARHLGSAMLKHRGLRRAGWDPIAGSEPRPAAAVLGDPPHQRHDVRDALDFAAAHGGGGSP